MAKQEPRYSWLEVAGLLARQAGASFSQVAAQLSWVSKYLQMRYGTVAAMSYDDRFAEHDGTALALGSVRGIRYWSVSMPFHASDGSLAIQLTGARRPWAPGVNVAVCSGSQKHSEQLIPVRTCGCGFWAYWAEDWGKGASYVTDPAVAGVIEGWGRYRAGTRGFRCLKAKILALCVQETGRGEDWRVACEEALAARYQVPVYS